MDEDSVVAMQQSCHSARTSSRGDGESASETSSRPEKIKNTFMSFAYISSPAHFLYYTYYPKLSKGNKYTPHQLQVIHFKNLERLMRELTAKGSMMEKTADICTPEVKSYVMIKQALLPWHGY